MTTIPDSWQWILVVQMTQLWLQKLLNTNNMQIIEFCCQQFNFILPSRQIVNRRDKFIKSDSQHTNMLTFVNM